MGQCGPHEHFSVACLGITMAWGFAATWGHSSVLMMGADVGTGVGGIGQSFLISNKFSKTDPALGQGVPCLNGTWGMSSSGGWLGPSFWVVVPVARLYTVIGIDSVSDLVTDIWVLTVLTVEAGAVEAEVEDTCWVSTLTLYPLLVIMVLFFCHLLLELGPF